MLICFFFFFFFAPASQRSFAEPRSVPLTVSPVLSHGEQSRREEPSIYYSRTCLRETIDAAGEEPGIPSLLVLCLPPSRWV